MTTDILREMVAGPIPRHSDDRELLRLFADRLWASFCEDMAAQYRRGVDEGERHSVERSDSGMCDTLRTISTECQYAMERISDESDYGRMYLGRVRNIARAALANGGQEEKEKVNPMSEHGNAAAMREVLKKVLAAYKSGAIHTCAECYRDEWDDELSYLKSDVEVALSKPPRNCDVGTPEEQARRFENFCLEHIGCAEETGGRHCVGCPLEKASRHITQKCELYWAQMPYGK